MNSKANDKNEAAINSLPRLRKKLPKNRSRARERPYEEGQVELTPEHGTPSKRRSSSERWERQPTVAPAAAESGRKR